MVEESYWQEKRFDRQDVLSAWTLVLAMLAVSLAFTGVSDTNSLEIWAALN